MELVGIYIVIEVRLSNSPISDEDYLPFIEFTYPSWFCGVEDSQDMLED